MPSNSLIPSHGAQGGGGAGALIAGKVQMTQMREQSLALTEEMAQIIPEDRDNLRDQIKQSADRRSARYDARKEIVDGLLERQQRSANVSRSQISAKGRNVLAELQAEVGYTAPAARAAATAAARAAETPAVKQVGETTGDVG